MKVYVVIWTCSITGDRMNVGAFATRNDAKVAIANSTIYDADRCVIDDVTLGSLS